MSEPPDGGGSVPFGSGYPSIPGRLGSRRVDDRGDVRGRAPDSGRAVPGRDDHRERAQSLPLVTDSRSAVATKPASLATLAIFGWNTHAVSRTIGTIETATME